MSNSSLGVSRRYFSIVRERLLVPAELRPATTRAVNVAFDDEIGIGHPVFNSGEMGLKRREPQQSVNNTNKQLLVSCALACESSGFARLRRVNG
jgi:hypothetical protein